MSAYCLAHTIVTNNVHSMEVQVDEVLDQRGQMLKPPAGWFAPVSRISRTSIARTSPSVAVSDSQSGSHCSAFDLVSYRFDREPMSRCASRDRPSGYGANGVIEGGMVHV